MSLHLKSEYGLFVGGGWVKPRSGRMMKVENPSTGEILCQVPRAGQEDVDAAVAAARTAFGGWSRTSAVERQDYLLKIAALIDENTESLARIVSSEMGMPKSSALHLEVPGAADHFRYFAGCIRAEEGFVSTVDPENFGITIREPLGVCALIVPWNFPLGIGAWKLAPALAAGNTVVFKPASYSPVSILELVRLIDEAGILPKGVLNVVTGTGPECGNVLAKHTGVSKISLTGSVEAGKKVLQAASLNVVPATMELGGKSPNIFFEDCHMDKAVEGAIIGLGVYNQGEVCSAGTRAFVHEEIYEQFVERVCKVLAGLKVGIPWDDETGMGPLVSKEQMEKVLAYVDIGVREGAVLKLGGHRITKPPLDRGYFMEPTVFTGVENGMRIAQEEIFGPVLCVMRFQSEEQVVALANESPYGLAAGVWTRDLSRAFRVSKAIRTGKVWVNTYDQVPAHVPFGGCKSSGFGRETHRMALDEYSNFKNVFVSAGEVPYGFYQEP